ncbi:MAG: hypothetical protein KDE19_21995, partial [Caldilineaceae bacterium]|nr:hypothetical protein [Caldilineaceae bacterium]
IPNQQEAAGSFPHWEWALENDTNWNPTATLKITIRLPATVSTDRYFLKVVLPNGVSAAYYFSM